MNARSMFGDAELTAMVFGQEWVGGVRKQLFAQHSGLPELKTPNDHDMKSACRALKHAAMMGEGNLVLHPIERVSRPFLVHNSIMNIVNRSDGRGGGR